MLTRIPYRVEKIPYVLLTRAELLTALSFGNVAPYNKDPAYCSVIHCNSHTTQGFPHYLSDFKLDLVAGR